MNCLSKLKWKLRDGVSKSAEPSCSTSWKQDGSFLIYAEDVLMSLWYSRGIEFHFCILMALNGYGTL